jgi:hypothetical protein
MNIVIRALFCLFLVVGLALPAMAQEFQPAKVDSEHSWQVEYQRLQLEIAKLGPASAGYSRLKKETLRQDALILASDKTPVDVALRRTRALLAHLKTLPGCPGLAAAATDLEALDKENRGKLDETANVDLFGRVCELRRAIAFKNPLLNFDKLVFLTHYKQGRGEVHMVDQYLGFNAKAGGDLYILRQPFSDKPETARPLAGATVEGGRLAGKPLANGSYLSLELDYDARQVWFAWTEAGTEIPANQPWSQLGWTQAELTAKGKTYQHYHWRPDSCYHIFRASLDGKTKLAQLTDGTTNDYDPCVLPSGRLAFISERIGGNQRCGARYAPTATLHAMMPDGSDIIPLSYHETNEWHPSVNNDGMIVYSRWDYVDRDSDIAHHLWTSCPDGRNPRSQHGNYPVQRESRPWMELSIRAIPGASAKYVAVAAPHHGQSYGSLVLINTALADDRSMSQIRRITPEVHFPESESAPGVPCVPQGTHKVKGEMFGNPWPLSEDFFLCVYDPGQKDYGIYLVDSFGNRILICDSPDGVPCLDPIPLRPRPKPPVIPVATQQAAADRLAGTAKPADGLVSIVNVYEADQNWPAKTKITALRIINLFPKPNAFADVPRIGVADQSLARGVLGTVPVEADGSVYFRMPAGIPVYFQALDAEGRAIHSMRSETYLHAGEHLSCLGCHESKLKTPSAATTVPLAMRREPSIPQPEAAGAYPLSFPRLIQPILDQHCVACHNQSKKAPDLSSSTLATAWDELAKCKKPVQPEKPVSKGLSNGFQSLRKYAWGKSGGNGALISYKDTSYSIPGQVGAQASKLYPMLKKGHHDVKLTPGEMHRIVLWLDCNSNFFGAYYDTETQLKGGIVMPTLGLPAVIPPGLVEGK